MSHLRGVQNMRMLPQYGGVSRCQYLCQSLMQSVKSRVMDNSVRCRLDRNMSNAMITRQSSFNFLEKKSQGDVSRARLPVNTRHNPRTQTSKETMRMQSGMHKPTLLPTSNIWAGLNAHRFFGNTAYQSRYNKFGQRVESKTSATNSTKAQQSSAHKFKYSVNTDYKRDLRSQRNSATSLTSEQFKDLKRKSTEILHAKLSPRSRTARAVPVGNLDPLNQPFTKSEMIRFMQMKSKMLLSMRSAPSRRHTSYMAINSSNTSLPSIKASTKSKQSVEIRKAKKEMQRVQSKEKTPEQKNLNYFIADILQKRAPVREQSSKSIKYDKVAPLTKLVSRNSEQRNTLHNWKFRQQVENPTFVSHPLIRNQDSFNSASVSQRRTFIGPDEAEIRKKREEMKNRLKYLLRCDDDDDDDDEEVD